MYFHRGYGIRSPIDYVPFFGMGVLFRVRVGGGNDVL